MKLTSVLLRWYRSFHINYKGSFEKGQAAPWQPWNQFLPPFLKTGDFPFIEIPLEADITTIVGANESGKSHLLNAIKKTITGRGLESGDLFKRTDLCHYASVRTKNIEASPQIGLVFSFENDGEYDAVATAMGNAAGGGKGKRFALIVEPQASEDEQGWVFLEPNTKPAVCTEQSLAAIRKILPKVQYIDSQAELSSEIALTQLLGAMGVSEFANVAVIERRFIEKAVSQISALPLFVAAGDNSGFISKFSAMRDELFAAGSKRKPQKLELLLFQDILGISNSTLQYLHGLTGADRGFVEGQVSKWNDELEEKLNLAHFWRQDEQFGLRLNLKDGIVYFEIHDKTDSIYTFRERSSGLRFFLSYYIQARALEIQQLNRNSIILMDEPDSALSVVGQRNLLSVFESLIRPETSHGSCQLIYTTHSPYLINRNFPRRVRVVKKEDAEEGTQFIENARSRRYEPVRTALGVDSAQSLFLGSTNVLLEGATDQYALVECIRCFSTPDNVGDFLDLNYTSLVSAEGVTNIDQVIERSQWADEPLPPTVVFLDGDKAGQDVKNKLIGKNGKKVVDDKLVILISEVVAPFGNNRRILTIEDIVPVKLYGEALRAYFKRWLPNSFSDHAATIEESLTSAEFANNGIVESTKKLFRHCMPVFEGDFDKMGVLHEVISILSVGDSVEPADKLALRANIVAICDALKEALEVSKSATVALSAAQAIKRLVRDFQRLNKQAVSITVMQRLFKRLEREIAFLEDDASTLGECLAEWLLQLSKLREQGQTRIVDATWTNIWGPRIESVRKDPLRPEIIAKRADTAPSQPAVVKAKTSSVDVLPTVPAATGA